MANKKRNIKIISLCTFSSFFSIADPSSGLKCSFAFAYIHSILSNIFQVVVLIAHSQSHRCHLCNFHTFGSYSTIYNIYLKAELRCHAINSNTRSRIFIHITISQFSKYPKHNTTIACTRMTKYKKRTKDKRMPCSRPPSAFTAVAQHQHNIFFMYCYSCSVGDRLCAETRGNTPKNDANRHWATLEFMQIYLSPVARKMKSQTHTNDGTTHGK